MIEKATIYETSELLGQREGLYMQAPIETVGGRHTGDRFEIYPQVERRNRSNNAGSAH